MYTAVDSGSRDREELIEMLFVRWTRKTNAERRLRFQTNTWILDDSDTSAFYIILISGYYKLLRFAVFVRYII